MPNRSVWIVVCGDLHAAAGLIPTQALARDAAAELSVEGMCTYHAVELLIVGDENVDAPVGRDATDISGESFEADGEGM